MRSFGMLLPVLLTVMLTPGGSTLADDQADILAEEDAIRDSLANLAGKHLRRYELRSLHRSSA